jgi:hypothetical protein
VSCVECGLMLVRGSAGVWSLSCVGLRLLVKEHTTAGFTTCTEPQGAGARRYYAEVTPWHSTCPCKGMESVVSIVTQRLCFELIILVPVVSLPCVCLLSTRLRAWWLTGTCQTESTTCCDVLTRGAPAL